MKIYYNKFRRFLQNALLDGKAKPRFMKAVLQKPLRLIEKELDMVKTNMTLRIEPDLKNDASALFKSLGMDLSTATGIFYRQALRCHGLPFEVKAEEPNAVTYKAMEKAERREDVYGPFDSVEDMMKALNA